MLRYLAAAGAMLAVAACTPGACDPSQAGFLSGIGCEASGSYATRSQYQQSVLAQENANALQARAAAQGEQSRATQAVLTRDQVRVRVSASDRQAAQLRARLAAARAGGAADQGRLSQAQAELDALQRQRTQLPQAATEEQLRALEAQRRRAADAVGSL